MRRTCCSTATTTCSRSIRSICGRRRRSSRASRRLPTAARASWHAAPADDKGQVMTFVEACRAYKAVTGALPLPITMMIEGEEECGSKHLFGFVKDNAAGVQGRSRAGVRHQHVGRRNPVGHHLAARSGLRGGAGHLRRPRSAFRTVRRRGAEPDCGCWRTSSADMHDDNGHVTIPGFYDGVAGTAGGHQAPISQGLGLTAEKFLGQVGLKEPAGETDRMHDRADHHAARPRRSTASSAATPARARRP